MLIKILKNIESYNVKVINLNESNIVMRMIGEDLSKENVKKQIESYLEFKRHYVNEKSRWD